MTTNASDEAKALAYDMMMDAPAGTVFTAASMKALIEEAEKVVDATVIEDLPVYDGHPEGYDVYTSYIGIGNVVVYRTTGILIAALVQDQNDESIEVFYRDAFGDRQSRRVPRSEIVSVNGERLNGGPMLMTSDEENISALSPEQVQDRMSRMDAYIAHAEGLLHA